MENIGNKIRKYRIQKDISQKQMAANLKIGKSAYSNIETGIVEISISRLTEIAIHLEVHYNDLLPASPRDYTPPNVKKLNCHKLL